MHSDIPAFLILRIILVYAPIYYYADFDSHPYKDLSSLEAAYKSN